MYVCMCILGKNLFPSPTRVQTHSCKPDRVDYIATTRLQRLLDNSGVVWAFAGHFSKYERDSNYEEQLRCNSGMTPTIISLDASWGIKTSYPFNLAQDVPRVNESAGYYYAIRPKVLRQKIASNVDYKDAATNDVTFRAEYVCNCPGACPWEWRRQWILDAHPP